MADDHLAANVAEIGFDPEVMLHGKTKSRFGVLFHCRHAQFGTATPGPPVGDDGEFQRHGISKAQALRASGRVSKY